jgi:hypothetical protein
MIQEHIDILEDDTSSVTEKIQAIETLKTIQNDIIEFINEDTVTTKKYKVTANNIDQKIDELTQQIQKINMESVDDIKELFDIKSKIEKCNTVMQSMQPTIRTVNGKDVNDITDKIQSKFVIASINSDDKKESKDKLKKKASSKKKISKNNDSSDDSDSS